MAEEPNSVNKALIQTTTENGKEEDRNNSPNITLTVRLLTGRSQELVMPPNSSIDELLDEMLKYDLIPDKVVARLVYKGQPVIVDGHTFTDYGIKDGDVIHAILRIRKPAIYLLSPTSVDQVRVTIKLCDLWQIVTTYPIVAGIERSVCQQVSWTVAVNTDGTLRDHDSGVVVSYLFWEAIPSPTSIEGTARPSNSPKTLDAREPFSTLGHLTSITLPFDKFLPYLDSALQSLCLTPQMRTEFISHWLPDFQQIRDSKRNINFAFLHQDVINEAAEISAEGFEASTVVRIYLVFRAVPQNESWPCAQPSDLVHLDWAAIIGLDMREMKNPSARRILEWGGLVSSHIR